MNSTQDQKQLQLRWKSDEIKRVLSSLRTGSLDQIAAPWIDVGGRRFRDLRGLPISEPIEFLSLRDIDLSYCVMEDVGQFIQVSFELCRFVGARLTTNFGSAASHCDFTAAVFGKGLRGEYADCIFVEADFSKVTGSKKSFVRCDFTRANFRKALMLDSMFDRCVWTEAKFRNGSFGLSKFLGTRPDPIALGNTMMDDVMFEER